MAKIIRKNAKIFGDNAGVSERAVFGSLAAGAPAFATDVETIQSLANWIGGWFEAVQGANSPAIEDMNAFCYVMAYQIAYGMQTGVPEWDDATTYYIGSLVNNGSGVLYRSLTDDNLNNALTDVTNWAIFEGGGSQSAQTASASFTIAMKTMRMNNTAGVATATLPAVASIPVGKRFTLIRAYTSTFDVTLAGNGAEVINSQYGSANTFVLPDAGASITVENNGASWDMV